jgi:hypothetical protein
MASPGLIGRRGLWPARAWAAGWLGIALWRVLVATHVDRTRYGDAERVHHGLLMVQAFCALVAGATLLLARDSALSEEPRLHRLHVVLLVLALAGFFGIFATPGLLDFGGYEN